MLRSWWRQALVISLFLLIASCSGGGCSSGCSSCGINPIAGGFDPAQTIANSASVRVTKSGLNFLGTNVPGLASTLLGRSSGAGAGVIDFNIPSVSTTLVGQTLNICQSPDSSASPEQCVAEIDIGGAQLAINAVTPDAITLSGTIPVRIQDIVVTGSVVILGNIRIDLGAGSNLSCNTSTGGVSANAGFTPFPINVTLPLVAETIPPRLGYTKIDVANATANVTISSSDLVTCSDDTGVLGSIVNGLLGALTGTVASAVSSQINGVVINELQSQLCTSANAALTPPCPNGTEPEGDGGAQLLPDGGLPATEPHCVYDTQPTSCLPIELGLEGNINLGGLLSSISPGTTGAVNFVLAGNGNMIAAPNTAADSNGNTPNGITLGMLGGANAAPPSECIPIAANPAPTGLTIPSVLYGDSVTGYGGADGGIDGGPDLGIAVNGAFLNYFVGSAYNSGMLCLGITTEKFQQLNTGLVSLIIPSLKYLTFEQKGAAIAITTRPQNPPVITLGGGTNVNTDPLLSVLLKSFILDFYVWSEDRYVRAFSFTGDITVPVNIQPTSAGIQPVLGTLVIANQTITNNVLITDPTGPVATSLSGVLGSIVGQLIGSGIGPINLASALSSLGLTFTIPPGGIQTLNETSDAGLPESYLGIFGNFGVPGSAIPQIDTQATLVGKTVHADAMTLTTMTPELAPSINVHFGSPADDGKTAIEYSWQLDQGTFSAWSRDEDVTIRDPMLWMQAKHTLQVVARVAGVVASQDPTPAVVPFSIDVIPPAVQAQKQDNGAWTLAANDIVSPQSALMARIRGTDANGKVGEWSDWQPFSAVVASPSFATIDLQVRDEEGNVGGLTPQLIRGGPDPTLPASGGCSSGCTAAPRSNGSGSALALGVAGVLGLLARRRRRGGALFALGSVVAVASTNQGCSCGNSGGDTTTGTQPGSDASTMPTPDGGTMVMTTPDGAPPPKLCGEGCDQPCDPALPQGLIGAYTSIAEASDGTVWVAGYNDAAFDPTVLADSLYGDLVVGKYNTTTSTVDWVTVDGLPAPLGEDNCPPADPTGWRGGFEDSGPDVGLWTSIVLDSSGHPMVSYYDATNTALKFAYSADGTTWHSYAVFQTTRIDAGRYSKMILVNGNPVIAYLDIETGTNGYSRTKVSLAHATVPNPTSASDWTIEDALVDETSPCRPQDCTAGQACVTSTTQCTTESTGCDAGCSSGNACIVVSNVPTCEGISQTSDIHPYPNAVGDYINISPIQNGIGLLVYDRIHGNLLGLTNASGSWQVTILDGETGSRTNGTAVDTGDDGVGASLFVATNGDWHVSYVDGITETLKYLYVPGGTLSNSLTPQIVDDGSKADGAAFSDGIHIVGDDSNVRQNADGSITITYMDATAGTLRLATGATSPGAWTLHALSQPSRFAGFFPHFVPGNAMIENWWRWADQTTTAISGNVAFVTP